MSPAILIYGDTERSPTLRHEVPLAIGDPFLFIQNGGGPTILTNSLERARIERAVPDAELVLLEEFGIRDLIKGGMPRDEAMLEVVSRAVKDARRSTRPSFRPSSRSRSPTGCAPTASS